MPRNTLIETFSTAEYCLHNPLGLKSDQPIISPYNFDTLSSRQVMRIKKIINLGLCLDVTPNSHSFHLKKFMANVMENSLLDLSILRA